MHRPLLLLSLAAILLGACQVGYTSPYVLRTVHESTFSRIFDNARLIAVVFGGGRYAW